MTTLEDTLGPRTGPKQNSRWRIIACDLDGTLIGWDHKINPRDLDSLRRARSAGFHVAICTGRNSRECAGVIAALGLEELGVFVNGAMVCKMSDGSAVRADYLPDSLAFQAIDFLGERDHAVLILADDPQSRLPAYCLTHHGPPHRATLDWLQYNRVHAEETENLPEKFAGRLVRMGVVVNVDQAPPLFADLQQHFGNRVTAHSIYSPHYDCQIIEIFPPGVNKWSGLEHLAQAIGAQSQEIIAIGDDINDLPMLQSATLSFAMGGSVPAVQNAAKRMTASQADCGVAKVIDSLLSGEFENL